MKKTLVLLLTAVLLLIGAVAPVGTGQAKAAQAPVYTELATFVDGTLLISPVKSMAANGSTYVPVKLAAQIPGITVNTTAGIVLTGDKGTAKLDATNSLSYKNSNYVTFKTLLKIASLDGKYASTAETLFIWSTEEGKTKSQAMLASISKMQGTLAKVIGKKNYVYGFPGYHWVTGVSYDGGANVEFTMLKDDGTVWTLDYPTNGDILMYSDSYLQYLKSRYVGLSAWVNNTILASNSRFVNMEKVTVVGVFPDPDQGTLRVQVRRSNGELTNLIIDNNTDPEDEITDDLFFKNPKTVLKISDKMWKAIQEERVVTGMTVNEVLLAWGEPDRVNDALELAIYGNTYLYFRNGKLILIV
ncbi:hypothetical protein [Paenibacillus sp. NFR01]|uniref:hypothetical protein n=1 Tax=Paenibacillus sp. NFR01 TaxID=1566279 RepID=UPI0008CDF0FE|nr:hypothetical protein [Paenibacillus sp. NFR01]SET91494.1 hypothetical protein SAMN03159358_2674 [Paenibacillus sp. NFR01]